MVKRCTFEGLREAEESTQRLVDTAAEVQELVLLVWEG